MMSVPMAMWTAGGRDHAAAGELRLPFQEKRPDRLSDAEARAHAVCDRGVQQPSGFLRHPESSWAERFVHVLGRCARERDLEVVNHCRAVGGQRRDKTPVHQIDEDWPQTRLDDVGSNSPERAAVLAPRGDDGADDSPEIGSSEHVRQGLEQASNACARRHRPRKILHTRFARARLQRIRADAGEIEFFVGKGHEKSTVNAELLTVNCELSTSNQHRIAITIEPIAVGDRLPVRLEHLLAAGKRGDEH